jgi:hypothetical protein
MKKIYLVVLIVSRNWINSSANQPKVPENNELNEVIIKTKKAIEQKQTGLF